MDFFDQENVQSLEENIGNKWLNGGLRYIFVKLDISEWTLIVISAQKASKSVSDLRCKIRDQETAIGHREKLIKEPYDNRMDSLPL